MTSITTQFTETELIDLGRAMEQAGCSSLEEFIKAAVQKRKEDLLTAQKP